MVFSRQVELLMDFDSSLDFLFYGLNCKHDYYKRISLSIKISTIYVSNTFNRNFYQFLSYLQHSLQLYILVVTSKFSDIHLRNCHYTFYHSKVHHDHLYHESLEKGKYCIILICKSLIIRKTVRKH